MTIQSLKKELSKLIDRSYRDYKNAPTWSNKKSSYYGEHFGYKKVMSIIKGGMK